MYGGELGTRHICQFVMQNHRTRQQYIVVQHINIVSSVLSSDIAFGQLDELILFPYNILCFQAWEWAFLRYFRNMCKNWTKMSQNILKINRMGHELSWNQEISWKFSCLVLHCFFWKNEFEVHFVLGSFQQRIRLNKTCLKAAAHICFELCIWLSQKSLSFIPQKLDFHFFLFLFFFFSFLKVYHRSKQNRSKLMRFQGGNLPEHQLLLIMVQSSWFHKKS